MIKIENTEVIGWEHAIRGMRNPLNSWNKSDSIFFHDVDCGEPSDCSKCNDYLKCGANHLGDNDFDLMTRLSKAGSDHGKFMRMIAVYVDIVAPLYWWKEFDTYKVGTVANSCSTMHKIHEKEFTLDDFSCEHLTKQFDDVGEQVGVMVSEDYVNYDLSSTEILGITVQALNHYRRKFIETKDKKYWWQMIQLLPSSYNQRRTVMLNYQVLKNMYHSRKNHKLDEWQDFCKWIESLPYSELITGKANIV